jgi:uncharacterized protein
LGYDEKMLELALSNLLSPPVLFFALGFAGTLAGSRLTLPEAVAKTLSLYLMLSIGFKGGVAVADHGLGPELFSALGMGALLSATLPVVAFYLLGILSKLDRIDRAAVAAHYGSISIVTFVAGSEALRSSGIAFEGYMVAVAAVMETPAILVALVFAESGRKQEKGESLAGEVLLNSSVVVLTGAFVIGMITGEKGMSDISPFIVDPFKGVLCLFLLDMGAVAARGIVGGARFLNPGLVFFGLLMPAIGALFGLLGAYAIGLDEGSAAILMILCASASYIAVPAAMRLALPQANPAIYLTLSLGITFPFNLTVGIPTWMALAQWVIA